MSIANDVIKLIIKSARLINSHKTVRLIYSHYSKT